MSIRYLSNIAIGIAGAFLVVATQAFTADWVQWLAFSIGALAVLVAIGSAAVVRDRVQQAVAAAAGVVGIGLVAMSLIFATSVVTALALAGGLALAAIALVGLSAHELRTERVVHELAVGNLDEHAAREERLAFTR
jgi:Na+(H+)/acetate symporter ActP